MASGLGQGFGLRDWGFFSGFARADLLCSMSLLRFCVHGPWLRLRVLQRESYRFSPVALMYNHTGTTRDCCLFRHPMRLQCIFPVSALAFMAFGGSLADDVPAAGWSRQSPGSLGVMNQWRH